MKNKLSLALLLSLSLITSCGTEQPKKPAPTIANRQGNIATANVQRDQADIPMAEVGVVIQPAKSLEELLKEAGLNATEISKMLRKSSGDLLIEAVSAGWLPVVKKLLDDGVSIDSRDGVLGLSPLHWADSEDMMRLLLKRDADVNSKDDSGYTPLHRAVKDGKTKLVAFLLDNSAEVNSKTNDGRTPLSLAILNGHTEVEQLLRSRGGRK